MLSMLLYKKYKFLYMYWEFISLLLLIHFVLNLKWLFLNIYWIKSFKNIKDFILSQRSLLYKRELSQHIVVFIFSKRGKLICPNLIIWL